MSEKLKPCPFCGGEAHLFGIETIGASVAYFVKCVGNKSKCAGPIYTKYCDTKERAAEVWNTRVERTCHRVMRGLKNAPGFVGGFCSECGHPINEGAVYCEHCGARVVSGDE